MLVAIVLANCSNRDAKKTSFIAHSQATKSFTSGAWHIISFKSNGKQKRSGYSQDAFWFTSRNTVSVTGNKSTCYGTWWVESEAETDDEPVIDLVFSMNFRREQPWRYLNGDWAILEHTPTRLRLLSLSAENTAYLTFAKDSER